MQDVTPDTSEYLEQELRLLNHGTAADYADLLLNRFMTHNAHMGPRPKEYKAIMKASNEERLKLKQALKETLVAKCIAPDEDQIIHYKEWAHPESFNQPSLMHLYHPHWRVAHDRILSSYKRANDTLVVMFCGGSKPYSQNAMFRLYLNAAKQGVFDFLVSSLYPVPVYPFDASKLYPYVVSDWHHRSSPRLEELSIKVHADYMVEFLKKTGYKKVIYHHIGLGDRQATVDEVKRRLPSDIELVDINRDEHLFDLLTEAVPGFKKNTNLMSVRWWSSKMGRELVAKHCADPDFARQALKLPKAPLKSLEDFAS